MNSWIEHLQAQQAVIERSGTPEFPQFRVTGFLDHQTPNAADPGALVCPLLDWVAVSINGAEAATFLQGQFTNDVEQLGINAVQLNGYCSPKGRMLANFAMARLADDEFRLLLPADIAAAFVRRLRMFVLRAKVVVTPLDATHACFGLLGVVGVSQSAGIVHDGGGTLLIGLPDRRTLAVTDLAQAPAFWNACLRAATPAGSSAWDGLAIRAGVPFVTAATQDRFVPQMLNWEVLGGVNFRKGCYTGQEIVARMQYLGRLKERLYRARVDQAVVGAGASVFGQQFGDQSCGTIINAAPSDAGGSEVLAVLQVSSAATDMLRLASGNAGPVLELLPLPYEIPAPRGPQKA